MVIYQGENDFTTSLFRALDEIDIKWRSYSGLIIPGSHKPEKIEEKLDHIKEARILKIPFLGICLGHQLAAIEYAQNVMGIADATSEEFGQGTYVVKKRKELNVGLKNGESYWNNFEVVIEWIKPEHFFTSQFHPEYQSSRNDPHPLLIDFIKTCKNTADSHHH